MIVIQDENELNKKHVSRPHCQTICIYTEANSQRNTDLAYYFYINQNIYLRKRFSTIIKT